MRVKTLAGRRFLVRAGPDTNVLAAANLMEEYGVGCVLVVDAGDILRGIVTDRDIVLRCTARRREPATTTLGEIMTQRPVFVKSDADVDEAARAMHDGHVRRLPVVDDAGRAVGILTLDDLLAALVSPMERLAGVASESRTPGRKLEQRPE